MFEDLIMAILYYTILPLIARLGFHHKAFDKKRATKLVLLNAVIIYLNYVYIFRVMFLISSAAGTPVKMSPSLIPTIVWSALAFFILVYSPKRTKLELKEENGFLDKVLNKLKAYANNFLKEEEKPAEVKPAEEKTEEVLEE